MAEEESTAQTIRDFRRREPFVPFAIVMASGDRYLIEDPDALAVGGSQLFYYVPRSTKQLHLRLSQITAVELHDERPAA